MGEKNRAMGGRVSVKERELEKKGEEELLVRQRDVERDVDQGTNTYHTHILGYDRTQRLSAQTSDCAGPLYLQCGRHIRPLRVHQGRHCHSSQDAQDHIFCEYASRCVLCSGSDLIKASQ